MLSCSHQHEHPPTCSYQPGDQLPVPAGFTTHGLPVGLQIVGRRLDEATVLRAGRAFEEATGYGTGRPPVPRTEMFRSKLKVRPSSVKVKFLANTPGTGH